MLGVTFTSSGKISSPGSVWLVWERTLLTIHSESRIIKHELHEYMLGHGQASSHTIIFFKITVFSFLLRILCFLCFAKRLLAFFRLYCGSPPDFWLNHQPFYHYHKVNSQCISILPLSAIDIILQPSGTSCLLLSLGNAVIYYHFRKYQFYHIYSSLSMLHRKIISF